MKERIVIKDEQAIDEWNRTIACCVDIDNSIYKAKFEKVPETFDELKILCEGIKGVEVYTEYISCHKLLFWKNGVISSETDDGEEIVYIDDRTPAQMWQIIKNLIGE